MIKRCFFLVLFSFATFFSFGQEFDFDVTVSAAGSFKSDPKIFSVLENDVREFFNRTKWTDDEFNLEEKIKGSIQLTILEERDLGNFIVDLVVQSSRPVYQSNYETTILNTVDKSLTFSFIQGQPILRSDKQYYDNLSSTLTFYAYIILGYDYDSFSPLGGDPYFNSAKDVMSALPLTLQSGNNGWESSVVVGRNKYWLITNQLDPRIRVLRNMFYEYHRLSLDRMAEDPDRYRTTLLSSLRTLESVYQNYPNNMSLQIFSDAKRIEIIDIFVDATRDQKSKIYDVMTKIDAFQTNKYNVLK